MGDVQLLCLITKGHHFCWPSFYVFMYQPLWHKFEHDPVYHASNYKPTAWLPTVTAHTESRQGSNISRWFWLHMTVNSIGRKRHQTFTGNFTYQNGPTKRRYWQRWLAKPLHFTSRKEVIFQVAAPLRAPGHPVSEHLIGMLRTGFPAPLRCLQVEG